MMTVDDDRLFKLFEALSPKLRERALKGALRRTARQLRETALEKVHGSLKGTDPELDKQVRQKVYRKRIGFRLTVAGSGKSKLPPILMWGEEGTKSRRTKTKTRIFRRLRRGHPTGEMPRYGFLRRTRDEKGGEVTQILRKEIIDNIERTAKRYGCRVT